MATVHTCTYFRFVQPTITPTQQNLDHHHNSILQQGTMTFTPTILRTSLLLLSVLGSATAFCPSPRLSHTTHRSVQLGSSIAFPKFDLFGASGDEDSILREIEKKEAALRKRKNDAIEKISSYEASLAQLESKKAQYQANMAQTPVADSFTETAVRSAVKALLWRVIAGSVTFLTTLKFSGSLRQALQVVGADFFSKAFTMFLGERLMNKSQAGRSKGGDAASRSLVKALIWRAFAICNTLTMAVFVSKDLSVASKIASTDAVFKTALMFFYERVWAGVRWGKEYLIEFSI